MRAFPLFDLGEVLACPDAGHKLDISRPDYEGSRFLYLTCTYYKDEEPVKYIGKKGVPNLLPMFLSNGTKHVAEKDLAPFEFLDEKGGAIRLGTWEVRSLLTCAERGDLRRMSEQLERIVESLPYDHGQLRPESVKLAAAGLDAFYARYSGLLSEQGRRRLLGSISLGRYIAELVHSGDYRGNFVAPDDVIDFIPEQGRIAEIGAGNGANLRAVTERRNPRVAVAIDNCAGMVAAAERMTEDPRLVPVHADAQYLPVQKDSLDALLMFNVIDRLQNPKLVQEHIRRVVKPGGLIAIGNCTPLQYDIPVNGRTVALVPEADRFDDVMHFALGTGIENIRSCKAIPWHPETALQGRENLLVDIVVGTRREPEHSEPARNQTRSGRRRREKFSEYLGTSSGYRKL